MQNKISFLLLIFLIAGIQSAYIDSYKQKDVSTSDNKYDNDDKHSKKDEYDQIEYVHTKKDGYDKKDDKYSKTDKYDQKVDKYTKYDHMEDQYGNYDQKDDKYSKKDRYDDYPQQSMYSSNRHHSYDSSPMNYRSRSQWTSPYENSYDDRSRSYWSSPYEHSYDDRSRSHWSPSYDSLYGYGNQHHLSNLHGSYPPFAFDNGPTCYPLLDPQYPLFSDICGAVPQARYSLPNAFGHIERWQIAQVLSSILNPATANPSCTRSLRLLICPLLFPPCATRHEAPPVLPCQPFCRVVKNQCASPSLDLLPCDFLPPTSDLCPVNPPAYGPPLSFLSGAQPGLLTQAALSLALSMPDISSSPFPSFPSSGYPPQLGPTRSPMLTHPSPFGPTPFSSAPLASSGPSFPPTLSPSSGYSSMQSMGGMPSSGYSPMQPMNGMPASGMPSLWSPLSMASAPLHQFLNSESYLSDRITPKTLDLPPVGTASYNPNPPQLIPFLRSTSEQQ